jgi:hypothetical protein
MTSGRRISAHPSQIRSKGLGDNAADHEARANDHRAVRIVHLRDLGIVRVGKKPVFNQTEHPTAD